MIQRVGGYGFQRSRALLLKRREVLRVASPFPRRPKNGEHAAAVIGRLLIVDDISDNRSILKRRFERRGFDVAEAESGLIAIDMIEKSPFDLVLLDVMMPGIDGMETLKRIRSQKSASALPVIMVTGYSDDATIIQALRAGLRDYVFKSVEYLEYIPEAVQRVLG